MEALDVTGKHKLLVAANWFPGKRSVVFSVPEGAFDAELDLLPEGPFEDKAELARFRMPSAQEFGKDVRMDAQFTPLIAFRDEAAYGLEVFPTLRAMLDGIEQVIPLFEPLFP